MKIYYSDSCLKYMNEGKEFGPNPPETSGLDAFIQAIKASEEKNDGSYRVFFKKIPVERRASLLKELFHLGDSRFLHQGLLSLMEEVPQKDRIDLLQQLAEHKEPFFRQSVFSLLNGGLLEPKNLMNFLEKAMESEYSDVRVLGVEPNLHQELSPSQQTDLIKKSLKDPDVKVRTTSLESLRFSKIPLSQKTVFIEQGLKDPNTDVIVVAIDSLEFVPKETQFSFQEKVSIFLRSYFDSSKDLDSRDSHRVAYALEADRAPLLRAYMEHSRFVPDLVYSVISIVPEKDRADLIKAGLESSNSTLCLAAIKAIDQTDWSSRRQLNSLALKKIKV